MNNKKEIIELIQEVFTNLHQGGIVDKEIDVNPKTVLIGPKAVLDSIAFVTLFVDLEEKLSVIKEEEVYLLIDDIHQFNPESTYLTVGVLADYIENILL